MVEKYREYGFRVTAKIIPKTCTACPFWLVDFEETETGACFLTGYEKELDGLEDRKRMDDCPIEKQR